MSSQETMRPTRRWAFVAWMILAGQPGAFAANFSSLVASNGASAHMQGCSAGYCTIPNQPQGALTTSQVQTFQDNWIKEINTMGQSITAAMQSQTAATSNAFSAANKNFNTMLKGLIPALLSQGYAAPKAIQSVSPLTGCSSPQLTQAMSAGLSNVAATKQVFNNLSQQYNNSTVSTAAAVQRLANMSPFSLQPSTIMPPPSTASAVYPKASDAANFVTVITNPLPPVQLTSGQKKTPAGVEWQAAVKAQQNRQTLAQSALNWLAGDTQPTMKADLFESIWKSSGLPGELPGVASSAPGISGPAISMNAGLQAVANALYANPSFQKRITEAPEGNLVTSAAMLTLIVSKQDLTSLKALEYMTSMLASQYSAQLQRTGVVQANAHNAQARAQTIQN